MKQIIKFLKKMSVENALFFFSMFGVAMMAFAFMGGNGIGHLADNSWSSGSWCGNDWSLR